MSFDFANTNNFSIKKLWYIPMSTQQSLYYRPYEISGSQNVVNELGERLQQSSAGVLQNTMISDIAANIIRPSGVAFSTGFTDSWMNDGHYVFILMVSHIGINGVEIETYIQGYTDHMGISTLYGNENAKANPQMLHKVSNIIEMSVNRVSNGFGGMMENRTLLRCYDVLSDNTADGIVTQRPDDIISGIKTQGIADKIANGSSFILGDDSDFNILSASNRLNEFSNRADTSKMSNNIGVELLTNVINQGVNENQQSRFMTNDTPNFEGSHFNDKQTEATLGDNRFLRTISSKAGFSRARDQFSFQDLLNIDSYGADNFQVIDINNNPYSFNAQTETYGANWNGQDPSTPVAWSIMQGAMSNCAKYGFSAMQVRMDNRHNPILGNNIVLGNYNNMLGLNYMGEEVLLNSFKQKMFQDVFMVESYGGAYPLSADVYVDFFGDTKVKLQFADEFEKWYIMPSVLNRHVVPVVSLNHDILSHNQRIFSNMIDVVTEVSSNNMRNVQMGGTPILF